MADDPAAFPPIREVISSGYQMKKNGKVESDKREPTEHDMVIINTREATMLFGHHASRVAGVSVRPHLSDLDHSTDTNLIFVVCLKRSSSVSVAKQLRSENPSPDATF